jgi:hypothetical protein
MTTMGQIKTHETVMWFHKGLVHLKVGRTTTQALDVDTPFVRLDVEGLESSILAKDLDLVDVLVTAIVSGARIALRVLVGHGRPQGVEDST